MENDEEERFQKLEKAKKITTILNWAGGVCLVWTLFFSEPYLLKFLKNYNCSSGGLVGNSQSYP